MNHLFFHHNRIKERNVPFEVTKHGEAQDDSAPSYLKILILLFSQWLFGNNQRTQSFSCHITTLNGPNHGTVMQIFNSMYPFYMLYISGDICTITLGVSLDS